MSTNSKPVIAYNDLREWLAEAERLGEVRHVKGGRRVVAPHRDDRYP